MQLGRLGDSAEVCSQIGEWEGDIVSRELCNNL